MFESRSPRIKNLDRGFNSFFLSRDLLSFCFSVCVKFVDSIRQNCRTKNKIGNLVEKFKTKINIYAYLANNRDLLIDCYLAVTANSHIQTLKDTYNNRSIRRSDTLSLNCT